MNPIKVKSHIPALVALHGADEVPSEVKIVKVWDFLYRILELILAKMLLTEFSDRAHILHGICLADSD